MIAGSDDGYEEIVTQIGEAASLEAMQKIASNICKFYHLANIAYHAVYIPGAKMFNPILVLTYDPGWDTTLKNDAQGFWRKQPATQRVCDHVI